MFLWLLFGLSFALGRVGLNWQGGGVIFKIEVARMRKMFLFGLVFVVSLGMVLACAPSQQNEHVLVLPGAERQPLTSFF